MAASFSLLATLVSLALAIQVGRQHRRRRRPHQAIWAVALGLFAIGSACQFIAAESAWSEPLYRVWYLSGAILAAAYLGQGTVYLLAPRRVAHGIMAVLLLATIAAVFAVLRSPVDLAAAISPSGVSGHGMARSVRLMTPFFNIFGTIAVVGGAVLSVWRFAWNGGSGSRALGTAMIGIGSLIVATGGAFTRFGIPADLSISELIGILVIFAGFTLTSKARTPEKSTRVALARRHRRVSRAGVGLGVGTFVGAIVMLPILPWTMGIVGNVKHVYTPSLPATNEGAYVITDAGVMQLYAWYVEPSSFPPDAPTLDAGAICAVAVVQKQFDDVAQYQLIDLGHDKLVAWSRVSHQSGRLTLVPPRPLPPGEYEFVRATDSMFGGTTLHYFRLAAAPPAGLTASPTAREGVCNG
ncbi:MAG: hypothetical protein M3Z22_07995 [Verrucomicrobiota bacterium]|nr:hypothetical protein [Verrucomicrobiota bacterium]